MAVDNDTPEEEQYVTAGPGWIFNFLIGRENGNSGESRKLTLRYLT